jgi:hypothetical protein
MARTANNRGPVALKYPELVNMLQKLRGKNHLGAPSCPLEFSPVKGLGQKQKRPDVSVRANWRNCMFSCLAQF